MLRSGWHGGAGKWLNLFLFGRSKPLPYRLVCILCVGRVYVFCRGRRPRRPKIQSYTTTQSSNAQCALKTSCWKFFGATFFSKKVAYNSKSDPIWLSALPTFFEKSGKIFKIRQDLFPYYYYIFQYFEMAEFFYVVYAQNEFVWVGKMVEITQTRLTFWQMRYIIVNARGCPSLFIRKNLI